MYIPFNELKEDSRIWIFQSDRKLTGTEKDQLSDLLRDFTAQWAAHGKQLKSSFLLLNNIHLIVGVDLSVNNASGCSIDALTHTIMEAGKKLDINFFDRKAVACELNGQTTVLPFENIRTAIETGKVIPDTVVYNNLISAKGDLEKNWRVKAGESWIKRYFSKTTFTT